MNNRPILLVDVDQCCVDTAYPWYVSLELDTKLGLSYDVVKRHYDFTALYKEELNKRGLSGLDWWKQPHIYDDLQPIEGAVDTLQWASNYFSIRFVSVIRGNHGGSKHDFLKRYFPFKDAVAWTCEKWMCEGDIILDDRLENLRDCKHKSGMKTFLYFTPHMQNIQFFPDGYAKDWNDVKEILEHYLENNIA